MLNKNNERELCYLVKIDDIRPIEGADRVELAVVGGWTIMVRKDQFKAGDIAIYFEIDSKVPETEVFEFLAPKHYKVKTQKYFKGTVISQGLLMAPSDFGWAVNTNKTGVILDGFDPSSPVFMVDDETRFLTKELKVTYSVEEDNKRKANSVDKYKKMAQRNGKLFSHQPFRWLMRHTWGKKLLFVFFGKKGDKKTGWPGHIAAKTDVERIQNMIWILNDKKPYVATEKVDGSSLSIMAERTKFGKIKQYVCSRNVVFEAENQKCFYDTNIYFEAYNKYGMKEKIIQIMNDLNLPNIAIQAEVYGPSVQKRDYSLKERKMAVFHIVSNGIKLPMDKTVEICERYDIPHVPIIDDNFIFPDTIEELQAYVEGEASRIDGLEKEGIVFYDKETGQTYTKFVSPNFLMKYHQ